MTSVVTVTDGNVRVTKVTAEKAWIVLLAAICAWEIACPAGQTLSEGVDRVRGGHIAANTAVHIAILATSGHLLRLVPPKYDLIALSARSITCASQHLRRSSRRSPLPASA